MTAKDVTDAIESQNVQIAVGQLVVHLPSISRRSTPPFMPPWHQNSCDITFSVKIRCSEVRLGDVATVEMVRKTINLSCFNGKPASGLGVKPGLRRKMNGDSGAGPIVSTSCAALPARTGIQGGV
ncbi:efflux RND transporter permease subunit [Shigella flexneri]